MTDHVSAFDDDFDTFVIPEFSTDELLPEDLDLDDPLLDDEDE